MTLEQIVVFVVFLVIALFNFVRQILRQRRQGGEPVEPPAEEPVAPAPLPPREVVVRPPPVPRPLRAAEAPRRPERRPSPVVVRPVRAPRRFSRQEVRRGIVLAMLLGPCPGLEEPRAPNRPQ